MSATHFIQAGLLRESNIFSPDHPTRDNTDSGVYLAKKVLLRL